ncbi:MAG TPA: nucleobase:cation symporter-2 family protein [Tissierellaceae bacterium]|uniref:uracil-xanthine permease family protein n=1 Tax=uncultured Clostridium sp. TaxID=59620 RepID=UPI0025F1A404|nr:nucleobase:cation symporter-2 family protein [uncultured Clostridium sp.]HZJ98897.1 nucleobase:cation symporter-2 family protein [Tissierellaceae bacterium]
MKKGSIYQLEGRVPLGQAVPLGIQHVLAMFLGNVSPLIIVCGLLNIPIETKSILIQNSMFVAGIATMIQLYPVFKVGSGLPVVMGTSSGFIGTEKAIGAAYGYSAIMGASLIGAILEIILGFFIKPLRKLFPPVVTSLVVISIGLSLLPVGVKYFAGGAGAADFGSPKHLLIGTIVMLVIIVLQNFAKGFIKSSAILIGIIVGYIVSVCMGMVDFTAVKEASWISLPRPFVMGFEFRLDAIISMCIMYVATTVETIGDISAISVGGLGREATDKELAGGVMADGASSLIAAVFGLAPNTSFSQNVGLVAVTKVVNKFVIMTGALFLILAGFFPKLSALLSVMPQSVLGGAAVIMFAMIFVSGLQSLLSEGIEGRNGLIVALAIGIGVGIGNVPEALDQLPAFIGQVFAQNGIIMTFVIATVLNLVLPKDKDDTIENGEKVSA